MKAKELETAYLAGVQQNIKDAGVRAAGRHTQYTEIDSGERVRAAMIDQRLHDRRLAAELPQGRGFVIRSFTRRLFFWKKLQSVTVASVLAPPEPLLRGEAAPPPVTLSQLGTHVRSLLNDPRAPHVIGICSPSGFEESVYRAPLDIPNVTLVLVEPAPGGGWKVSSPGRSVDERILKLFNPENVAQKLDRVRREIEERRTDLLTGGLSAASMAARLALPVKLVQQAFEAVAKGDPELRVSKRSGDWLLFRGAAVFSGEEDVSMLDWIRNLFSREGDEARKINVLSERRAALSDRLNRMYDDIGKLEKKEAQLLDEGKAAASNVVKRRIAAQISHLRSDIGRCNTSAALLSKQINIISTHIHNLQLAQTGSIAQLPSSEELTEAAVNAEEMLEQLAASDELVTGLEVSMAQTAMSEEEAAILKELEGAQAPAATGTREATPPVPQTARSEPAPRERSGPQAE
ncbi:MAG: hypothetical protein DCC65_04090 [Planctomycetota bacterium]|nr:MAG: hypothetical protein DCC65_04090 [Planctomycetota bacterium]